MKKCSRSLESDSLVTTGNYIQGVAQQSMTVVHPKGVLPSFVISKLIQEDT